MDFEELLNQYLQGQGSSPTTVSSDDPPVFWGYGSGQSGQGPSDTGGSRPAGDRPGFSGTSSGTGGSRPAWDRPGFSASPPRPSGESDRTKTLSEAQQEFYLWDEDQRRKWGEYLLKLGLISPAQVSDYKTLEEAWKELTADAANLYAGGRGHRVDPWQAARVIAGSAADIAERKKRFEDEVPFTGTRTQVSKSVDLTDPTQAKAVINDVLSQMLGRAANPEELSQFTATLNAAERANPEVTTTTGTYDAGDLVSTSSVTSGGVDRGQILQDRAMNLPDYGAFQAATTYADALFRAIQSPV